MDDMKHHKSGFTLIEVVIAITLFGLLSMMVSPYFKMFMTVKNQTYIDKNTVINEKLAEGLLNWAKQSKYGQLPMFYSSQSAPWIYNFALFDPADNSATAVLPYLLQTGVPLSEINEDGTANQNVRVYQPTFYVTETVPFSSAGIGNGSIVNLNYSVAVIYMTQCGRYSSCNSGSAQLPGDSPQYDTTNLLSFKTIGTDLPATFVSTRELQRKMLTKTRENFERIRDAFAVYARTKSLGVVADDKTNWYLNAVKSAGVYTAPATVVYAPNPALELPTDHCWENWYSLKANPGILKQLGLDPLEVATNAWGGDVEFCPDYDITTHDPTTDPSATGNPNSWRKRDASPHFAGLRMNNTPLVWTIATKYFTKDPDHTFSTNNFEYGLQ